MDVFPLSVLANFTPPLAAGISDDVFKETGRLNMEQAVIEASSRRLAAVALTMWFMG